MDPCLEISVLKKRIPCAFSYLSFCYEIAHVATYAQSQSRPKIEMVKSGKIKSEGVKYD